MPSSKLRSAAVDTGSDECSLDMSPMIDMVFLLLLFFLVNASAIIVKGDPDVKPPVAVNSKSPEDGSGRIVVNVRENGTFTSESLVILKDEADITDLVKIEKEKIDRLGLTPRLHLRGDKETVFRHSRTVIRAAANAGVDQVIFAVFVREP